MPNQIDKKTLQYLTRNENLPAVLEVLRYREAIAEQLLRKFWTGLQAHLQKKTPNKFRPYKLRLGIDTTVEKFADLYAGLCYRDENMSDAKESLYYFIDHEFWGRKRRTLFGLAWWTDTDNPSVPLTKLPEVVKAKKHMIELGFKSSKHSLGWREMTDLAEDSVETFLTNHVLDPRDTYRQIEDSFFPMVEASCDLMLKANKAIKRANGG